METQTSKTKAKEASSVFSQHGAGTYRLGEAGEPSRLLLTIDDQGHIISCQSANGKPLVIEKVPFVVNNTGQEWQDLQNQERKQGQRQQQSRAAYAGQGQ